MHLCIHPHATEVQCPATNLAEAEQFRSWCMEEYAKRAEGGEVCMEVSPVYATLDGFRFEFCQTCGKLIQEAKGKP